MEGYWARGCSVGAITRRASAGDSPHDGGGSIPLSPRETRQIGHPSRLSPKTPRPSELGEQLRPDRDHPDEQRQRRQRSGLFHENLQHAPLHESDRTRTYTEHCSFFVLEVKAKKCAPIGSVNRSLPC